MKIVHLARDEKFLPLACSLFEEAFPGANTFVVLRRLGRAPRFALPDTQVRYRFALSFHFPWLLRELRGADIVVVHAMTREHARALRGVAGSALVVWIGHGFDYYSLLRSHFGELCGDKTLGLAAQIGLRSSVAGSKRSWLASIAPRLDVFSVNPVEADPLREAVPALRARYHPLPSFTVEDVFDQGPARMAGPDMMLGNSAAPTNNHLEALELLTDALPQDARLIVPLSYGCRDPRYADHVEAVGRGLFGERFVALRTWMPVTEYQNHLGLCGTVLMHHRRQQGVGNIAAALYKGARVFLQRENPLFDFFTGLGAIVIPVDALSTDPGLLRRPLDEATIAANRASIIRRFNRASVIGRIRALETLHR